MKWASSSHYVSVQFEKERVAGVWSAPARVDEVMSGSMTDRWSRWWNFQRSRFR